MGVITISMTEPEAQDTLNRLQVVEQELEAELARVRGNIDAFTKFLSPVIYPVIKKVQSAAGNWYTVKYFGQSDYTCECMSYRYMSGLDADGNCKHIRQAISEGTFA